MNRRDFLKLVSILSGGAAVAPPSLTLNALNPSKVVTSPVDSVFGTYVYDIPSTPLQNAAIKFGRMAEHIGYEENGHTRTYLLAYNRTQLLKYSDIAPADMETVLAHPKEACDFALSGPRVYGGFQPAKLAAMEKSTYEGMQQAALCCRMSDAEFEEFRKKLDAAEDAKIGKNSSKKETVDSQSSRHTKADLKKLLTEGKEHFRIRTDTLKHATTQRIKITLIKKDTAPVSLAELKAHLSNVFARDDINLSRIENRIIVRNPSHSLREVLRPYLQDKQKGLGA